MTQALDALALFASDESDNGQMAISAYKALQQTINRKWVGLTKEEFFEIYHSPETIIGQMSMIEAKLKEKNYDT